MPNNAAKMKHVEPYCLCGPRFIYNARVWNNSGKQVFMSDHCNQMWDWPPQTRSKHLQPMIYTSAPVWWYSTEARDCRCFPCVWLFLAICWLCGQKNSWSSAFCAPQEEILQPTGPSVPWCGANGPGKLKSENMLAANNNWDQELTFTEPLIAGWNPLNIQRPKPWERGISLTPSVQIRDSQGCFQVNVEQFPVFLQQVLSPEMG